MFAWTLYAQDRGVPKKLDEIHHSVIRGPIAREP
jgi:hypothetical protein